MIEKSKNVDGAFALLYDPSESKRVAKVIGKNIRDARMELGLRQLDISIRFDIPINTISQHERGLRRPTPEYLQKYCTIFNKDPSWFLRGL